MLKGLENANVSKDLLVENQLTIPMEIRLE
jgi:hypothetical protein